MNQQSKSCFFERTNTIDDPPGKTDKLFFKKGTNWDFPGGAVNKTLRSQCRGPGVRELHLTCMLQVRVRMPQLRSQRATIKEPACRN